MIFMLKVEVRIVTLCKDCVYWKRSQIIPAYHVCTYVVGATVDRNADDYCSRAEERKGDDDFHV